MKKIIIAISSLILFNSCSNDKKEINNSAPTIHVQISEPKSNTDNSFVNASGKIEAEHSANISTRIMGYVTKVNVKVGQKVNAGQLLISINNSDLQAKKAQVEASILQAAAGYNNVKKDYDRFVNLFKQQSASQKELDDITAKYEMAKAGLEGVKQMRNEIIAQFSYANITAPFAGVITNTFIKEGDMANPGMPLISIEGVSKLQATAMVAESEISNIKEGMPVKVFVKSLNTEIDGKVIELSSSAKNTGGQYLVKVSLDKIQNGILSGMFINLQFPIVYNIQSQQNNSVWVPESALIKQGQLIGIYTIGNGNVAILRWLRIGKKIDNKVEVLSGLNQNESYILSADSKLTNGAKVSF
jgi:RND family efflux transporter MFP subunit